MFRETLKLALQAIRINPLRSFLTVLGIVIGVGAVITMVALGTGAQRAIDEIFARFIVEELPPGLTGLLIAGVFAAAMSTLSSSLNSCATAAISGSIPEEANSRSTMIPGLPVPGASSRTVEILPAACSAFHGLSQGRMPSSS